MRALRHTPALTIICLLLLAPFGGAQTLGPATNPPSKPGVATFQGYQLLDAARQGSYLRRGSSGQVVMSLQKALNAIGYSLTVDGIFGAGTEAAVEDFQQQRNILVDGVVGPQTMRNLDDALGIPVEQPAPAQQPTGAANAGIPVRSGSITGSDFYSQYRTASVGDREAAILQEMQDGNIPDFLRRFQPVTVSGTTSNGQSHTIIFQVMPDYLSIGSDKDFLRVPMGSRTAQDIADTFNCSLPTAKMVDLIWQQAGVKMAPIPLSPGSQMGSMNFVWIHHHQIEQQRRGQPLIAITAGHKKDLVLSNQLAGQADRMAIYGWHQPSGSPIQSLSTAHTHDYVDYSHGIRLVQDTVVVDGQSRPLADVLSDPVLSELLSDEGPLSITRIP